MTVNPTANYSAVETSAQKVSAKTPSETEKHAVKLAHPESTVIIVILIKMLCATLRGITHFMTGKTNVVLQGLPNSSKMAVKFS